MRLLKKIFKFNNQGLSLVEVLCAVAVFSIATTAIGSAMVVSAQQYQRNSNEFDVQQEVQTTTNLIGNLIVDSVLVSQEKDDENERTLKIDGAGVTYYVQWNKKTGDLIYKEDTTGIIENAATGILAQNVTDFNFDLALFESNKNVVVDVTVEKGGRYYSANYNATCRNGNVSTVIGALATAELKIESKAIVEPGQTYTIPVEIEGLSMADVDGLKWDATEGSGIISDVKTTNDYIQFKVEDDAAGEFAIDVVTSKKSGGKPIAVGKVEVLIRRVTDVVVDEPKVVEAPGANGNKYLAGTQYTYAAHVDGDNLSKLDEANCDKDSYNYIDPRYIHFRVKAANNVTEGTHFELVKNEDTNTPSCTIVWKTEMPQGSSIEIEAIAKHPQGMIDGQTKFYNKASAQAKGKDEYADVKTSFTLSRRYEQPWDLSGLRRGDNNFEIPASQTLLDKKKYHNDLNSQHEDYGNDYRNYIRILSPADQATDWILIPTTGDQEIKIEKKWSQMFEPLTEYVFQLKCEIHNTTKNKVVYPKEDTPEWEYMGTYKIEPSSVRFREINTGDFVTCFGKNDTFVIKAGTGARKIEVKSAKLNSVNLKSDLKVVVDKFENGIWKPVDNVNNIGIQGDFSPGSDGDVVSFSIQPQNNSGVEGRYRGTILCNFPRTNGLDQNPVEIVSSLLGDVENETGMFYFTIER